MKPILILTNLLNGASLERLREGDCVVVPIPMEGSFIEVLNAMTEALFQHPPTSLSGAEATWLPRARDLGLSLSHLAKRQGVALDWDTVPKCFSQILVATRPILPIDLIPCDRHLVGTEIVVAHIVAEEADLIGRISAAIAGEELPLRRIAHVCTYYPGSTSLYQMDVVSATLGLNNRLAMEHYFYPPADVAKALFKRSDLDILHFECHGTTSALQIDHPFGVAIDVRRSYASDGPKIYFFLGCNVGSEIEGVAPFFVQQGAKASLGSYCTFLSGGESGKVSLSIYYDKLYGGLASGQRLGDAVRAGRKAAFPERIYYCAWLLFGNPNVHFVMKPFGGAARRPRVDPATSDSLL